MKQRQHLRRYTGRVRVINRGNVKVPPNLVRVRYFNNKRYVATGVDAKGRVQYLYPKRVKQSQSVKKYDRVNRLMRRRNEILGKVVNDSKQGNVEAQAVYTMFKTGFRPGSDRDTRADVKAFGATTLLKKHVRLRPGNRVDFDFIGKKGVRVHKEVKDKLLADVVKERKDDPRLFDTSAADVRDYFDKKTGGQFMLKDLRTLKAFEVADKVLNRTKAEGPKEIKKEVVAEVSKELGNTPAIAAEAYIAPKLEGLK